ncbi:MAG TPA: hypothetical protein VNA21_13050 [Steroidobacteraceae bacterium]|nr:hypothetical protein [Steroidobacteraceae bacterium]
MHDNRDDYEPIIADRRSREPLHEDTQPLWRLVLALAGGLVVVILLAWWFIGRTPRDVATTSTPSEASAPEVLPEENVEQAPAPPARDPETDTKIAQAPVPPARDAEPAASAEETATPLQGAEQAANPAESAEQTATPESVPEAGPDNAVQTPAAPAPISLRIMSPDAQVRVELRGPVDSSPLTSKAGEVIDIGPGTYRVVASGTGLETLEQDVTFENGRSVEYTVELCAEPKRERETLTGQVVEERACATTAQCESMFMVLSEHAEQLVNDRAFRTQQCAKWRSNAAPEGKWTLNTDCGGATLATTCRIEIAEGACSLAGPRRSVRGTECPRTELN